MVVFWCGFVQGVGDSGNGAFGGDEGKVLKVLRDLRVAQIDLSYLLFQVVMRLVLIRSDGRVGTPDVRVEFSHVALASAPARIYRTGCFRNEGDNIDPLVI